MIRQLLPFVVSVAALLPLSSCRKPVAGSAPALPAAPQDADINHLPPPPQQAAPWNAPQGTDASGLSPELIAATQTLFDQGLADPRGGVYQSITVEVGDVWRGRGSVVETHGWVFPAENGAKRFAVCWNGLVYSVVSIKGAADLQADVENAVKPFQNHQNGGISAFQNNPTPEQRGFSLDFPSLMQVALLLRANKPELARQINAVWEARMPPRTNGNDEIRRDPYGYLVGQWVWAAYDRAVCAHMRGADALVLSDTDLLTRALPAINTEIAKRNYKSYPNGGIYSPPAPYFWFLENLPELKSDAARRVSEGSRPPLDLPALQKLPQNQRIAALIARLDEVAARQSGQPGGVGLDEDLVTQALIKEGDKAVEPLLDTMETDTRLTRSVSFSRDFHQDRNLLGVKSAAFVCFAQITNVSQIPGENGKKPTVAALREWWAKNKGASLEDRWFTQLADEQDASPGANTEPVARMMQIRNKERQWEEAAKNIVERSNIKRGAVWTTITPVKPGTLPPMKGKPLRGRQNPSVADLLKKRAEQALEPETQSGFAYAGGANYALMLYEWEPKGPQTLPLLQTVMRRCIAFAAADGSEEDQTQLGGRISRLTLARIRLGDTTAAEEYGKWVGGVRLRYLGSETQSTLMPLWKEPENAALRRVSERLFASDKNVLWSRILSDPKSRENYYASDLFGSRLLETEAFRNLVLLRLQNRTITGAVMQKGDDPQTRSFAWLDGSQSGPTPPKNNAWRSQTLRICDRAALALERVAGTPRFDPMASAKERDKACAAFAAYLKKWGSALGGSPYDGYYRPLYSYDMGDSFGYLGPTFEQTRRPASSNNLKENRAIFALSGKTRVAPDLPALPLEAEWKSDPNADNSSYMDGKTTKQIRYSRGFVWQAEDKWDGKKWVRFFGYVGPHSIAKVPAAQIRITDYRAQKQAVLPPPPK